ncbi:MAG: SDR family oxidoreductase [Bacteroidales bacterium]|nr:SDR family oxidoreductase [Bacteroidales bacterium]MDD4669665.1 SDR family oxidoreductase [Bacteroidales bacterium]
MHNPFSLEGKIILVTGASSGIGRGIAAACADMGARLVITGRNETRLDETFQSLSGTGHTVIAADLSTQEGIDKIANNTPTLNGCAFCAGIAKLSQVKFITRDILEEIVNINEISPILLTAQLLKKKKFLKQSSLIYIASLSGVYKSKPGEGMYAASKGAISGFVKDAALELAPQNIRVNAICPAFIQTEMTKMFDDMIWEVEHPEDIYPLKRLGTTSDIANGAIYLLSDASSWVTGINLLIDGGYCIA